MSGIATFTPMPLYISDAAVAKVKSLVEEEGNPDLKLRVFVTGGGCSGFQYGFSFDEVVAEDDTLVEKEGVAVLVDPLSIQYLSGSTVDYEQGLQGSRFTVSNPNAATTCGCGSSFSV
ncbi:MAG: iron-sulfur cluster insertion protein ErpA [Gammaproteobacteria bacterium]|nr:MAG: iron-sulfur cluster insertion protein ErpA [Gammaproteobacteria bacterium]